MPYSTEMKFRDILISIFLVFDLIGNPCFSQVMVLTPERAVELAFASHPQVKNSELRIKQALFLKESAIQIPSLNFNYYYGQIHSVYNDKTWSVTQSLGSIPSYIINQDLAGKKLELSKSELEMNKRDLQMKVRSAYFSWIYRLNRMNALNEELEIHYDFLKVVKNKFEKGELGEQVLALAINTQAENENDVLNAEDEADLGAIALKELILTDDSIIPESSELEMIAILPSTDSLKRFSAEVQLNQLVQQIEIQKSELKLEKWKFFPELHAGYFNQEIGGISGFRGWQAGLSFPLWFLPQNSAVKRAKIETEMAQNNLKSMQFILDKTIDGLLTELNKAFRQISYSEKYQLKQAEELIQFSRNKFQKEEIGYLEYLKAISDAMKVKMDFLDALENYNQIAVKLEYFISIP
jgi:cobalt-zinc-cadmium resistance protein CzcA